MTTRELQVTIDCAGPGALAVFWAEALGYERQAPPPGFETWDAALEAWHVPEDQWDSRDAVVPPAGASGPRVLFQRVPEPKTVKNRVHLDVRVAPGLVGHERMAALEAESDRLVALGATRVRRVEPDGAMESGFIVMTDPEGHEFCLD